MAELETKPTYIHLQLLGDNSWLLADVAGVVLAMFIAVGVAGGVYVTLERAGF